MAYQTSSAPTPCTRCGRDCGSHWTIVADGWDDAQVMRLDVMKHQVKDGSEERTVVMIGKRGQS